MKLKNIILAEKPIIAVVCSDVRLKSDADAVEVRVDQFSSFAADYVCGQLKRFSKLPSIVTIRQKREDSRSKFINSEQQRLALFKEILSEVPAIDAFDIELNATEIVDEVIKMVHRHHKIAIVSFHNFRKTPSFASLAAIINKAKQRGADIVKIATQINAQNDIKTLELLTKTYKDKQLIVIGMGEKGIKTRIRLPLLGSLITFAANKRYTSAVGQLNYAQTKQKIQEEFSRNFHKKVKK